MVVLRIRDVYSGSEFFPSRVKNIQDPGSGSASKNLSILIKKMVSKLLEIWSGMFIPDPGFDFFYPSRIQVRIHNTGV
jgi:hypothetical protein